MAQSISKISELTQATSSVKVLNFTEELEKINKVKHSLGLLYFAVLTVMMTTLFF